VRTNQIVSIKSYSYSIPTALWNQDMKTDLNHNEIDELEQVLSNFSDEWKIIQNQRAIKWRMYFFIAFIVALVATLIFPSLWWFSLAVIAYFAGSLFTLLRQNAKTNSEIIENKKQLKLVRFLRNFQSSPYSEK